MCYLKAGRVMLRRTLLHWSSFLAAYRTNFSAASFEYSLHDFVPTGPAALPIQNPTRLALTTAFRRFRDVDQSASVVDEGRLNIAALRPSEIGFDVEFACIALNASLLFGAPLSDDIWNHIQENIAPRLHSPLAVETVVAAATQMLTGNPARLHEFLRKILPAIDALVPSMKHSTVVLVACSFSDSFIAPPSLMQALLERSVMLKDSFSFHEAAHLLLAFAKSEFRSPDVKEMFEEFAVPALQGIDFAFAEDTAVMLFAYAIVGVAIPELVDALGRRLSQTMIDLHSEGLVMSIVAMAVMGVKSTLLIKQLCDVAAESDLSGLHPLLALDCAWGFTRLGIENENLIDAVASQIVSNRNAILEIPEARKKLLEVSAALNKCSSQSRVTE